MNLGAVRLPDMSNLPTTPSLRNIVREIIADDTLYSVEQTESGAVLWAEYACPVRLRRNGHTLTAPASAGIPDSVVEAVNNPARWLPLPAHYAR